LKNEVGGRMKRHPVGEIVENFQSLIEKFEEKFKKFHQVALLTPIIPPGKSPLIPPNTVLCENLKLRAIS
jgi:hypothetical protein